MDFFILMFFIHVLCLCATLWIMTDLLSYLYVHVPAWVKAPYSVTVYALSCRNLFVVCGSPPSEDL